MKRLFTALVTLSAGCAFSLIWHNFAATYRDDIRVRRELCLAEAQQASRAQVRRAELVAQVRELHRALAQARQRMAPLTAIELNDDGPIHLTGDQREEWLAEWGFDWHSIGDSVIVSKDTLPKLSLQCLSADRLTDTVCDVLAITPEERAGIDALTANLAAAYRAWAATHVQRVEPEGNVLAKYMLPADPEFFQGSSASFSEGLKAVVGRERSALLLGYASSWMDDLGMHSTGATTLTVNRSPPGQEWLLPFELRRNEGDVLSAAVTPVQPFPAAFLPLFPEGWSELARREQFDLPKKFWNEGQNP